MKRLIAIAVSALLLAGCLPVSPASTDECITTQPLTTQVIGSTAATTVPTTIPSDTTEPAPDPEALLLASMTLEEKVGQMFLARCPDINAVKDIEKYHLSGYVLFSRDFENATPQSITKTIGRYQEAAKIPMLIAVDEEGGTVCRVSSNKAFRKTRFSSPRSLFSKGGLEAVLREEQEKCLLLQSVGINVNLAPVCDIATDPNAFMYKRSLGQSPETTASFIAGTVSIMSSYRIGGVLKHFPGYGNNTDTHVGIAVDDRSLQTLETYDLIPFAGGIAAGCDAIMISHTIMNAIDPKLPASLSPAVLGYLRNKMGFTGVTVTDDLDMAAITKQYGTEEAAVLAVLAGCDLLCTGSYEKQYQAVLDAVTSGRISMEQIDSSVLRILRWKAKLALLDNFTY